MRVKYHLYKGVTHEFFGMGAVLSEARKAVNKAAAALSSSLDRPAA